MALLPVGAKALSCVPHSIEAAYTQAVADDLPFSVVRGTLGFDVRALPKGGLASGQSKPPLTKVQARLSGRVLSQAGFKLPFNKEVTLEVSCFGVWCAHPPRSSEVLVIVQSKAQGDVIALNPCGGQIFDRPDAAMFRKVRQCFDGKACAPPSR